MKAMAGIRVRWLKNNGVRISRPTRHGVSARFEPAGGLMSVPEAAAALKTYPLTLWRRINAGEIKVVRVAGRRMIAIAIVRALVRDGAILKDRRRTARVLE